MYTNLLHFVVDFIIIIISTPNIIMIIIKLVAVVLFVGLIKITIVGVIIITCWSRAGSGRFAFGAASAAVIHVATVVTAAVRTGNGRGNVVGWRG